MLPAAPASSPTVVSPATRWVPVRSGKVISVAASHSDAVFALDDSGSVWRLPNTAAQSGDFGAWTLQPGHFVRLRAAQDDSMWGIDSANRLYRWTQSQWMPVAEQVRDVAVTPDGVVMLLSTDGRLQFPDTGQERALPVNKDSVQDAVTQLLSDEHGQPWLLYASGRALRWQLGAWQAVTPPGLALTDLAIGNDGSVLAVTSQGRLLRRVPQTGAWQDIAPGTALPDKISHVTLDSQGWPWISADSGALWVQRLLTSGVAPVVKPPALFTRLLKWRQVGGASSTVGVGPDGTVLSLSKEGAVWQWKSDNKWSSLGGNYQDLAVGSGGAAWALDARGGISALERGYWQPLPGVARRIAAGPGNVLWSVTPSDDLQWWNAASRQWVRTQSVPKGALQLAMGPRAEVWLIDTDGTVQTQQGARWQSIPGITANSLAVGPEGTVYATQGSDQSIYWLDQREMQWKPATGRATFITVGPDGAPWIVAPGNVLMASGRFLQEEAARTEARQAAAVTVASPVLTITVPPLPTQTKPLVYQSLQMADLVLQDIGIGGNGAVFGLAATGSLYCFSNQSKRFLLASQSQAKRVAVTAVGAPWLLNTSGSVTRLERGVWQLVPEFLGQDISVGPDGMVWALDRQGDAYRFVTASNRFERVPLTSSDAPVKAKRIAGANGNVHWLVTDGNQLMRCEKADCRVQLIGVQDVVVAPDNTVFALDLLGAPRRYNLTTKQFDKQNGSGVAMAVGPQGLPWLLTTDGKVSYAGLFDPLSRTVNTDNCPTQFSQAPTPVDPPNAALRVNDIRVTLPPGGSLNLLTQLTINGRATNLSEVTISLGSAPGLLQIQDAILLVAPQAPQGVTLNATLSVCPKLVVGSCTGSNLVVQTTTAPPTMIAPTAVAGNGQASVAFVPVPGNPGSAVRGYVVTASPGGRTATGAASPLVVTGLQNGTRYTFIVQALSSLGAGPASPPSNVVTPGVAPDAPRVTGVLAGNQQVSVAFVPPVATGGAPVTGFVVAANPGDRTATGVASPLTVTGLVNGTAYTFTVRAINALGQGAASAPSMPVTPLAQPGAPTNVVAVAGDLRATVSFAAPANNGGAAISNYTVTASPGGASASAASSPITVLGLQNGQSYNFTVRANNSAGAGPASVVSNTVTPVSPISPPSSPTPVSGNNSGPGTITVDFGPPASNGGSPVLYYTVTATPGGASANGTTLSIPLTGLASGTYTVRVTATNAAGTSAPSVASAPVSVP